MIAQMYRCETNIMKSSPLPSLVVTNFIVHHYIFAIVDILINQFLSSHKKTYKVIK